MGTQDEDSLREAGRLPKGRLARTARVGRLVTGQGLRWAGMRTANRVRTPERATTAQNERTAALVGDDFSSYWVYVTGPLAGALIAVAFAYILRGAGGTSISRAAGSGVLDPGLFERRARLAGDIEKGKVVPPGIAERDKPSDEASPSD